MANTESIGIFQMIDEGILHPNDQASIVDSGLLISGINYTMAQHNAEIDAILRLFCGTTSEYQLEVQTSGASRNQAVDEFGRVRPIKPTAPYTVAFPIKGSGNAMGATYVKQQLMRVEDLANWTRRVLRGDAIWVRDQIWAALYDNVGYTFRDPEGHGDLAVKGLANSDTVTYYKTSSGSEATDTHYLAQAASIADSTNPYPTIKTELLEHPENGGSVICFIPTNLVATTTALAEFHSAQLDPDIQFGTNTSRLVGSLNATLPPNTEVLGKTESGVWIVEWKTLPSSYIIGITSDGPRPLMRRQYPVASLQGFHSFGTRNDFPYFEDQWQRHEGYGGFNRVGAVVCRVGNATYDNAPTNYVAPIA